MANLPKTKPARQYTEEELEQIRTMQRRQGIVALAQNFVTAAYQGGDDPAALEYYFDKAVEFYELADQVMDGTYGRTPVLRNPETEGGSE